jgi:choline dehydrogenase-like flavoprotein
MPLTTEVTSFARDVPGRYVCNTLQEMNDSARVRPFDVIVIGGGTFGGVIAQHLFFNDVARAHRILVLEGGPFLLPEHVQNAPMIGLSPADATSVADLKALPPGQQRNWEKEVWGLPWHSNVKFPGLAYCVGGRSLYWGGWSPEPLDSEMTNGASSWPATVVADLRSRYYAEANDQIGSLETNDFIYGPLHTALRARLFAGIARVSDAIPLARLPDHPAVRYSNPPPGDDELVNWLGLSGRSGLTRNDLLSMLKLEAPLAVQSQTDAGRFPINKFSAVPLLIKAARSAYAESAGDDTRKRLMIVPFCHVKSLTLSGRKVTRIETNQGPIQVPNGGSVILGLGTIENTRLALNSFQGTAHYGLIGQNLIAHLRSNLTIRVPRASLPDAAALAAALSTSALFVKGEAPNGNTFHLQITASGVSPSGTDAEAELWQKIPDLDLREDLRKADDRAVVITIRAIGEMEGRNPQNFVRRDPNGDQDFGTTRAFVSFGTSAADTATWDAMDQASDEVAKVFANNQPFEVQKANGQFVAALPTDDLRAVLPYTPKADPARPGRRDGLGTTHHEAGTLWMGDAPDFSVTNADGRFWDVDNTYVVGPALLPRLGSPNPMLTGVALARRLGDRLIAPAPRRSLEQGFSWLFDGTDAALSQWRFVGGAGGGFLRSGRALVAQPGNDIGLLYVPRQFHDFTLRLDFMLPHPRGAGNDNSGIFVRFRDPLQGSGNPQNPAIVAVNTGFEVQIDEEARGDTRIGEPDGNAFNRTGAIYKVPLGAAPGSQEYLNTQQLRAGEWNALEIRARGNHFEVFLNGQPSTRFDNVDASRGTVGCLGLQTHTGHVAFANVRVRE